MLVLLISIISVVIVIGVATTIYVQNSKQKKQYDEKLIEVVSKTDNANQYEYEKNKDQEVALDKVKGDMMAYNQNMASVKKDVDYVKTSYGEKINNLGTSILDMQKQTNIFQTDVTKIDNTQNTQINTLTGDVTNIKKDVTNLNSQYAVINGKIVNINDKQQVQIDKLTKNYDSMMTDHGSIVNNMAALKNDLNSTSATQNKSITDFQNNTKQTLADQKITADNVFSKATSVENTVKTLNTALDNLKQSLNDYMLKVNMKDYASQTDLTDVKTNLQNDLKNVQSIFNNYMTKTDFNTFKTTLPDYPTRSEMNTLVNNFLTKSEVGNINATIASVQTSINNFQGVITTIKDTYATKNDLLKVSGDASQGTVNIQSLYVMLDGVQKNLTSMQTNITSVRDELTKFQTDANNAYALKTDVLNLTKYIDQQTALIKQNITNTFDKLTVNSAFTANGDLTLNNMKFSRNYSGYPDTGVDKSEISNDTTNFKKLMIVGNKSAGGVRSVGVWDKLDVYGDLSATNITGSKLTTDKGIAITNNDPGSLIEKNFGSSGDRYGIGYSAGVTRMYAATAYPGKTSLSQAKADGSFDDVLTINSDKSIDMNTTKINLPGTNNIYTKGRQNMSGDELLYILNKQGAVIGKEGGGTGDLTVQGNAAVAGTATIGGTAAIKGNTTIGGTAAVTGNTTIGGTAAVTGNTTIGGTAAVASTITGDQVISNKGVVVKNDNPGPLVEKNYGGNDNRYGVGQFTDGWTRMYTATAYGGKTALSQAKSDGTFNDVLVVNPDKSITMNTPKLCINSTCITEADLKMMTQSPFDSVILTSKHSSSINTLLPGKQLRLLFRGSRDGSSSVAFHNKCDNIAPLFIVCKANNNYIATVYVTVAFKSIGNYSTASSGTSWINNLDNGSSLSTNKYYNTNHPQYTIYDYYWYGPTFGGGHDLYIPDNFLNNNGSSNPYSYAGFNNSTLFGTNSFRLSDLEVFAVS
jgi:hypothetical protein